MRLAIVLCAMALQAAPDAVTVPGGITIRVSTDRTTLYPGDRMHYIARVEHSSDIQFVQDHVRKDQLSLEPFEVLNVDTSTGDLPGGRKFFEVQLLLTTYDIGHPDAAVPSFNLFYFRRAQTAGKDTTPAETLAVPPLKIGLRSTIVDPAGTIRDDKPMLSVSRVDWMLPVVLGLCGLVAALIYGLSFALQWIRSGFWKRKMSERIRKKSLRESFEEIRHAPLDSRESVESFYTRASTILRGVAAEQLGDCGGLTPRELEDALRKSGDREAHASAVGNLVEQCDLVRYSPDSEERARARHSEFLRKFEELVERR